MKLFDRTPLFCPEGYLVIIRNMNNTVDRNKNLIPKYRELSRCRRPEDISTEDLEATKFTIYY